jgi:hypothetical protein
MVSTVLELGGQKSHLRLFSRSGDPSIVVVKFPEYGVSNDTPCLLQVFMNNIVWRVRYALTKPLMRPGMIEIRDVFPDDAVQVTLTQDQDVIQTFASHAADEAITEQRIWQILNDRRK